MLKKYFYLALFFCFTTTIYSQYWQQYANYTMEVELDDKTSTYEGNQKLIYTNNSPETLKKVFYHLYFNAFQPNSEMAIRIKNGGDKNTRFKVNIDSLSIKEQGYLKVFDLRQDGVHLKPIQSGTILEVPLASPIKPGETTVFELTFKGQVPDVVRRAGKNSKEGIDYSMAQWYPKLCEYDVDGWNADPYTGREFHGVWGDFDVKITLDKKYTVAASGYLQNAKLIGKGYADDVKLSKRTKKLTWHFIAPNVHDFTWAADKNYIHDKIKGPNDVELHFFYKDNPNIKENWKKLQPITSKLLEFYNTTIGPYPYKQYSVIQGGDGGMEYAMCTLITGERKWGSLVGVTAHELAHSWFQFILATNETKHEWMDEGFTTFISTLASNYVLEKEKDNPYQRMYDNYLRLATAGIEQPQTTNANRYHYNAAYETTAYSKGSVFLAQLGYIVGFDNLFKTLQTYYDEYQFKHPTPKDFRRIAERVSNLNLDWYLTDWTQTTNTIDYAIKNVTDKTNSKTKINLERIGLMPMPLEILVEYQDGTIEMVYIPISLMRGEKEHNDSEFKIKTEKDWFWASNTYSFEINSKKENIKTIIIDPHHLMADINKKNNYYPFEKEN